MPLLSLTRRLDNGSIVERLRQEQKDLTATSLAFFDIVFTRDIAAELIALFRKSHQRTMVELSFYFCPGNGYLQQALQVAVDLDLFWNLHIKGIWNQRVAAAIENNGGVHAILPPSLQPLSLPLQFCNNLRRLQLSCLRLSREDVQYLRQGLEDMQDDSRVAEATAPPRYGPRLEAPQLQSATHRQSVRRKRKRRLDKLSISNSAFQEGALEEFCVGLRRNNCLEDLALVSCGLSDDQVAQVIRAIQAHPSLTTFRLYGNQCHRRGCQALVAWLSRSDCKLASLQISHQSISSSMRFHNGTIIASATTEQRSIEHSQQQQERIRLGDFTASWPTTDTNGGVRCNRSLKHLKLNGNCLDDEDMRHAGALLQRYVALEELDLDSNKITDKGLTNFAESSTAKSGLRTLRLSRNDLTLEASHSLLRILNTHPQLDSFTSNDFWKKHRACEPRIRHLLDINSAGRILLQNGSGGTKKRSRNGQPRSVKSMARSLWPVVFARINRGTPMSHLNFGCRDEKKCANGIYFLLRHGPALLEQQDMPHCQ